MTTVVNSLALAQLRLPAYDFTEVIHQGQTTAVYRAVEIATQRSVVVKVLCQDYPSLGTLTQFRNQFTITQTLPSKGIVRPLALLPYGNSYALVMADEGGIDLGHYARQQPLSVITILQIGVQLADILHTLHHHGVIHKDIKPANLLIHPDTQQIQLIDFGIASRLPTETQTIQNPTDLEGTLAYLAPEQTGRMNRAIDYRTDFYALGVTLYELFTGQLPFPSPDPLTVIHCHMAQVPSRVDHLNPKVPPVVAAIVARLMAKNAEDRYQSALGLKHDLERCLALWPGAALTVDFPLGERDVSDRFTIPEKLYGRETEVQALMNAFDRVAQGASEVMLVAGFSGIGKTAVINEVHKPIVKQRGYFIKGKFDQFNRNTPFFAFVQAFRSLIRQLLGESDAEIQAWRTKILAALGDNAQVIIDLIPELAQITGPQSPAPALSGTAAQHRFNLLFQRFIQVFATAAHPLVIFIDDLQWSDSASLHLVQILLGDPQTHHLLLLGSYRDNEVFPGHPLMVTLEELAQVQATIHTLTLPALALHNLNQLIADTLGVSLTTARPLTDLVIQKTQGNPFFATQVLKALHQDQLIIFDYDAGHWQYDLLQIQQSILTDDVVALMVRQLQKLPHATQAVLKLAACIGAQFDLHTLAIVSEQTPADVATALWPALEQGMILPQSHTYKFFWGEESSGLPAADAVTVPPAPQTERKQNQNPGSLSLSPHSAREAPPHETTGYRFLHDRIQQATYSLIEESQRKATHLTIGKLLQKQWFSDGGEEHIFEIVNQINIGRDNIADPKQRQDLAQLNLKAAQKAIAATAYAAALDYADIGIELLDNNGWNAQYETTLALYNTAAKASYLNTQFERVSHYSEIIFKQAKTLLEKSTAYELEILIYAAQKNVKASALSGLNTLALLGIEFPTDLATIDVPQALEQVSQKVHSVTLDRLLDLPRMEDATALAAMRISSTVAPSVYKVFPVLYPLIVFKQIDLSITYGNADLSAFAYAAYGLILCGIKQDIETGYRFGEIAESMLAQFDSKALLAKVCAITNAYINPWKEPLEQLLLRFLSGYKGGLAVGDLEFGCYCAFFYCTYSFYAGKELAALETLTRAYSQALTGFRQGNVVLWNEVHHHTIVKLLDPTFSSAMASDGLVNDADQTTPLSITGEQTDDRLMVGLVYINKLYLNYLFGQYEAAVSAANMAAQYLDGVMGMFTVAIFYFYDSLARLAYLPIAAMEEQAILLEQVRQNHAKMAIWAASCPENCQHKYDLVEAEYHRTQGQKLEALEAYDRAIAGAKTHGYLQEEALANELAMQFYRDWGKQTSAEAYAKQAYYGYARWGAKAKVVDLETRYPDLLRPILQAPSPSEGLVNTLMTLSSTAVSVYSGNRHGSGRTSLNQSFDFASILEAAKLLASTLQLSDLLRHLPQIILKNSGGDRCVLLLPDASKNLQVRAISTLGETVCVEEPLANNPQLPVNLIQYVKNCREAVIINEPNCELPVQDPYVTSGAVQSLACLPILGNDNLLGIVYLSSQVTRDIFDANRIAVLSFLSSQAATALANAKLYDEIQTRELHYRSLIKAIPDLIMRIGRDGRYLEFVASPNFKVLGTLSEWVGEHVSTELPEAVTQQRLAAVEKTLESQKIQIYEQIMPIGDEVQYEEVRVVPNGQNEVLMLVRDISDRKLAEAALRQRSQDLEQALAELQSIQLQLVQSEKMSALGGVVAGVAHEINNPLGCILGNISATRDYVNDLLGLLDLYGQAFPNPGEEIVNELAAIDIDYVRTDVDKLIQAMQDSGDRIRAISRSLRTFSRADTDSKQRFNLQDGLDSTLLILRHRLKGNEYRPAIEVVTDYGDVPEIFCFPGQLNQVFMNILANAVDAFDETCQGRSFQDLKAAAQRITIRTERAAGGVKITLADNGPGIPDDIQDQIFDHLFTTKGVGKGTGLGLAIARQIVVEAHGGSLTVDSQVNQGTAFSIQLPL